MRFQIYVSILASVLSLSVLIGYYRDLKTQGPLPMTRDQCLNPLFQEAATQLADRVLPDTVVEWQVYGPVGEDLYVGGLNALGEEVFNVVFDRRSGNPKSIVCASRGDAPVKGIAIRTPRAMADFWLRRLAGTDENPYHWIRDRKQGERYFSCWQNPRWSIALSLNIRTGQIVSIRFHCLKASVSEDQPTPWQWNIVPDQAATMRLKAPVSENPPTPLYR